MGIYTKTGDKGETSLFDGVRVKKSSLRVNAYGTLDELNAHISVAEKVAVNCAIKAILKNLQYKLFYCAAEIATADVEKLKEKSVIINDNDIKELEHIIDSYAKILPKVDSFILPGRFIAGAELHVARTVCRRAERLLNEMLEETKIRDTILIFMNRLSDCLYMLARMEDMEIELNDAVSEVMKRYEQATNKTLSKKDYMFDFDKVEKVIKACINKADELKVPVVIALVDDAGKTVAFYKMQDSLLVSTDLAHKKAYTAVAMKEATHNLQTITQPGQDLYQLEAICNGQIVTFGGGLPLYSSGNLVGGLGVSGGTVEEDIIIASAGKRIYEKGE